MLHYLFRASFIVELIEGFGIIVLLVVSQRIAAGLVRGKGKLNACFVATLYATALIPFAELFNYFVWQWQAKIVPTKIDIDDLQMQMRLILMVGYGLFLLLVSGMVSIFVLNRLVTITKIAHRVGSLRAV